MNIKRSIAGVAVAALVGLGFAACGGASTTTPAPAKPAVTTPAPVTTSPPTTAAPSPNQAFLSDVCSNANKVGDDGTTCQVVQGAPSSVVAAGQAFCSDMANGSDVGTEEASAIGGLLTGDPNLSGNEAGIIAAAITTAAVEDLCPQYASAVQAYANSGSSTN
jgi:hypothetical protein